MTPFWRRIMRLLTCAAGILALCGMAISQPETSVTTFDVADVHRSPAGTRQSGLYLHANRLELHGITMLQLINRAYNVAPDKIFGGPNWLDTNRYEVIAKSDAAVSMNNYPLLLRALLADRFQLKVRNEDKPEPIYALMPAKRGVLKPSTAGDGQCKRTNEDGYLTMTCSHITMASLAEMLPSTAPNYFDHPVVDKTGFTDAYDITLKWTGRGQIGAGDSEHPSIQLFDYFFKQLGIKV